MASASTGSEELKKKLGVGLVKELLFELGNLPRNGLQSNRSSSYLFVAKEDDSKLLSFHSNFALIDLNHAYVKNKNKRPCMMS